MSIEKDPSIVIRRGRAPGPSVAVFGGVHGNEPCGVEVIDMALERIGIDRGCVYFVKANPEAIERNQRFVDYDLNRCFGRRGDAHLVPVSGTRERARAEQLITIIDRCEALLDIHTTSNEKSVPFIICEPHSRQIAECLGSFRYVTHGWDAIQPGGTDYYMNTVWHGRLRGRGICVECGRHDDPEARTRAIGAVSAFLVKMAMTSHSPPPRTYPMTRLCIDKLHQAERSFSLARKFVDFERLPKGTVIGWDGGPQGGEEHVAESDCYILFAEECDEPRQEAYLLASRSTDRQT